MTSINVPGAASAPIYRREAPLPTPEIGTGEAVTQAGKLVSEYAQQQDRVRQAMNQMIVARQKNIAAQQAAAEQQAEKERIAAEQQAEKERMNKARESQAKTDADERKVEKKGELQRKAQWDKDWLAFKREELQAKKAGGFFNYKPGEGRGPQPKTKTYPGYAEAEITLLRAMENKLPPEKVRIAGAAYNERKTKLDNLLEDIKQGDEFMTGLEDGERKENIIKAVDRMQKEAEKMEIELEPYRKIAADADAENRVYMEENNLNPFNNLNSSQQQPTAQPAALTGLSPQELEIQAAEKWLQENPTNPMAPQVQAKLQSLRGGL